ncbi:DUF3828 domain-containing protein [Hymenobacter busanensis]|uniref:DUF3828 domain-containing protein n=1 Tax=Hymenobacter busanensis TaxID=2607656 RepID=A0A7L4ZT15_9BACT|nr:DUF3828 domain-containing protein [Hymenobacter busanensis]KAA9339756.1 DUF3828 domain-containing protein [Hymenobacter busanensis]QHJ06489.1 DUF3828 domain-containing protein [Hymenobacter busanensis]
MKGSILISLLSIFLVSCTQSKNESIAANIEIQNQNKSNAANIKKFYRYYISEMDKTFPRIRFNEDTLHKYCTSSFLKKRKYEREFDMVLQAQDYFVEWTKNLTIEPTNNMRNNEYNVCFPVGEGEEHNIIVTVKKEQGNYKISSVRRVD